MYSSVMIKTVIFDIDGTLYDYNTASGKAMAAISEYVCTKYGWTREMFNAAHKEAFDALNRQAKGTAASHNRLIRYGLLAEQHGLSQSDALAMDEIYWTAFIRDIVPFPYLAEALACLKKNGIRIGAGTNMTAYAQYLKLRKLELLDAFDFIVTSEEALAEKPKETFFERCAERAGCAPEECLFIGDETEKDVNGARRIGMHALLVSLDEANAEGNEGVLYSYRDLPEIIRAWNAKNV